MRCKCNSKSSENRMGKNKKGLWSPDEDQKLTYYIMNHGHDSWSSVPINAGLQRNGKSCRLRWFNYLRPGLKRGAFSSQEEETIMILHGLLGNKWSQIAKHLSGRTDNEIKNYWHSQLKKKVAKLGQLEVSSIGGGGTNPNIVNKEPSSSSLNTSKFTNSLSADMDQAVPPVSQSSHVPRVLFADWISMDEFQQDFGKSNNQPVSCRLNNHVSTTAAHEWQLNEGSAVSNETRNYVNNSSNENMLHTEMTIDQIFNFVDSDFNIDDFMYM